MLSKLERFFSRTPQTPSFNLHLLLCYNTYIQINESDIHLTRFSQKFELRFSAFWYNDIVKAWHLLKHEYHLNKNSYFQWMQLISKIPEKWKFTIKQIGSDTKNVIIHDHHLIKASRILIPKKSASKELYLILILQVLLI